MPEKYDRRIQAAVAKLEESESLSADEALALANEVAIAVNDAIRNTEKAKKRDFRQIEELARRAEEAYLLAASKVPIEYRDVVAFASTYWSLRADHARLDAQLARADSELAYKAPVQPVPQTPDQPAQKELSDVLKRSQSVQSSEMPGAETAAKGSGLRSALFKGAKVVGGAAVVLAAAAVVEAIREPKDQAAVNTPEKTKTLETQGAAENTVRAGPAPQEAPPPPSEVSVVSEALPKEEEPRHETHAPPPGTIRSAEGD